MPLFYADASALVKLVRDEPESHTLRTFLVDADLVSCELVLTEIPRAIRRAAAHDLLALAGGIAASRAAPRALCSRRGPGGRLKAARGIRLISRAREGFRRFPEHRTRLLVLARSLAEVAASLPHCPRCALPRR